MIATAPETITEPRVKPWFKSFVILFSVAVTILVSFIAGFAIDNALDGMIRDRSIWGILLMILAVPSWIVLYLVVRYRKQYSIGSSSRRWTMFLLLPGSFWFVWVFVFIGYGNLDSKTSRPILPHTPILTIRFTDALNPSITTRGQFGFTELGSSDTRSNGMLTGTIPFHYRTICSTIEAKRVVIKGEVLNPNGNPRQTQLELVVDQRTRVRVEGLKDMLITLNGNPSNAHFELGAGTYKLLIVGEQ